MSRCPSELQLEALLAAPEASPLGAHVASCAACGARLEEMRALGEEFRREVYPRTVDAVAAAAARPGRRRWLLFLAPLPALAAAAIALLAIPRGPPEDYVGIKGDELAVTVFALAPHGARALVDGERVPAASALRFQLRAARPCRLWLVSVDGAGQVSRLYPASGEPAPVAPGPVPGGAVLDGRAGPERIFAVCSPKPLAFAEVERSARSAAGGGEAAVRAARVLPGLPAGARQATLLREKLP
jgi:hypothetical protein